MIFFVPFISIFFAVGFGMLGYGLWSTYRSLQAANWPKVTGILTSVEIKDKTDNDGTTYNVEVEYTYAVAGIEYHGSRLAFGYAGSSTWKTHNEIYQKLMGAKTVEVRYNPSDPATSTLSFGVHRSHQLLLTFAVTWLAFVSGFALLWWLISASDNTLLENIVVK